MAYRGGWEDWRSFLSISSIGHGNMQRDRYVTASATKRKLLLVIKIKSLKRNNSQARIHLFRYGTVWEHCLFKCLIFCYFLLQLSFIQHSLMSPEVFCFADYPCHTVAIDILKAPPEDDNREIATWYSYLPLVLCVKFNLKVVNICCRFSVLLRCTF